MGRILKGLLLAAVAIGIVEADDTQNQDSDTAIIRMTDQGWQWDSGNTLEMSWSQLQTAFQHPNRTDTAVFSGRDWTKPYPGSKADGFKHHLRIANDVPIPDSNGLPNQTTVVTALTHSVPKSMLADDGQPKPLDPSWYICRYYYVTMTPDPTIPIDHACGFLPSQCLADLKTRATANWNGTDEFCFRHGGDGSLLYLPESCVGTLGSGNYTEHFAIGWDTESYKTFPLLHLEEAAAVDKLGPYSVMVGTGFVAESKKHLAQQAASNRTYLVMTAFGWGPKADKSKMQTPEVDISCLRASAEGGEETTGGEEEHEGEENAASGYTSGGYGMGMAVAMIVTMFSVWGL